ncbi:MAG: hypothetical protein L0H53_11945 [Candidatus Nitrosocosmicus sp.]|nr:hypothetical protein [Candidatus Nitrosocosmicus sp.]MDN5866934.1 hypothetical protein [Candidatus Nitrosocosmicus sp.]
MKISCSAYITSSFLIIYFILFAFQSVEPANVQALNEAFYSESQSYLENNNLPGTAKNNNSTSLIFSNPFYLSNTTLMLDKIPIEKSNATYKEVQFFVERGVVNASLVTYNMGYYIEDSHINGSYSEFKPQSTGLKAEPSPNNAKGSGIFLTANGGIIKWEAIDQIANKSGNKDHYTGVIFFSPADEKNNELAFLKNQMGLYEFSIDSNNTTTLSSPTSSIVTTTTTPTTHRSIWLWP